MIINKKIWRLAFLLPFFVACSEEDTTNSTISSFVSYDVQITSTEVTIDESTEASIPVSFVLSGQQQTDVVIDIEVSNSSTAIEGVDFDLSTHSINVPALSGQDTVTFTVDLHDDLCFEEDETVILNIKGRYGVPTPVEELQVATITSTGDIAGPQPYVTVDYIWGTVIDSVANGEVIKSVDLCDAMDYDIGLIPEGNIGFFPLYQYYGISLSFDAMTGSCPEGEVLALSEGDGNYYIGAAVFASDNSVVADIDVPITVVVTRYDCEDHVSSQVSYTQVNNVMNSSDAGVTDFVNYFINTGEVIGRIAINGDDFEVYDENDELVGTLPYE